jgi:hypothetical protein
VIAAVLAVLTIAFGIRVVGAGDANRRALPQGAEPVELPASGVDIALDDLQ